MAIAEFEPRPPGRRNRIVEDLARIVVSGELKLGIKDVAALRRNGDAFMDWRTELRRALSYTDQIPLAGEDWVAEARAQLQETLTPAANRLEADVKRSALLSAARVGSGAFALSGIGTAAWPDDSRLQANTGGSIRRGYR